MLDVDGWRKHSNYRNCFKSVEHAVEVTAKKRLLLVTSVTPISTLKMVVWTAACHTRLSVSRTWKKSLLFIVGGWLYVRINKDGTTKNEEKKKRKKLGNRSTKKVRKLRKAGKVQQVIEGGGVQVGACERPGRRQPSPLRRKIYQVGK